MHRVVYVTCPICTVLFLSRGATAVRGRVTQCVAVEIILGSVAVIGAAKALPFLSYTATFF